MRVEDKNIQIKKLTYTNTYTPEYIITTVNIVYQCYFNLIQLVVIIDNNC